MVTISALNCASCFEQMNESMIALCGHSFCLECIQQANGFKNNPPCPSCKQAITVLAPNYSARAAIEELAQKAQAAAAAHSVVSAATPADSSLSTQFQGLRVNDKPSSIVLQQTTQNLLEERRQSFFRTDTFQETVLRSQKLGCSTPLLFKESQLLPRSMCRIGNSMDIFVGGVPIIRKTDSYPVDCSRDDKARIIVEKLLPAINKAVEEKNRTAGIEFETQIDLLSKMDGIDEHRIPMLDTYSGMGRFLYCNRHLIPIRLISREAACMAIVPVNMQIGNYSSKHCKTFSIKACLRDQWSSINIRRTPRGFEALGSIPMAIQASFSEQSSIKAATFDINAKLDVTEADGTILISIERKNLCFMPNVSDDEDVSDDVNGHILAALDQPL